MKICKISNHYLKVQQPKRKILYFARGPYLLLLECTEVGLHFTYFQTLSLGFFRFFELDTCRIRKNITQEADDQIKTINITEVYLVSNCQNMKLKHYL